jgi:hypothetical protein
MSHDFATVVRKGGPHSAWCGGKVVDYIRENGAEVEFCFTDGTSARFEWVNDNGDVVQGKLRCKSLGIHIRAASARLGRKAIPCR